MEVKPLPYDLEIEEYCIKHIEKLTKKNAELKKALDANIRQVLENPTRFKPLHFPMQNKFRVHVLKSFGFIYSVDERGKTVKIEIFDHHDNLYEKGAQ